MTDRRSDIISNLENSLQVSITLFQSLKPEELNVKVYEDGESWTVIQVLAHLTTIEQSMQRLFNNILSGGPGAPPDFDIERFNRSQPRKLFKLNLDELIQQFCSVREITITIVRNMDETDLDREGLHAFHGHGTLERFIRWAYEHQRIHEEEIRRVLQIKLT
jgi:DinB superfamily